jgi:uncharacterized protein YoxC
MGIALALVAIAVIVIARYINIKLVSMTLNRYRHDNFILPNH